LGEFGRFARGVLGGEELPIGEECACRSHFGVESAFFFSSPSEQQGSIGRLGYAHVQW